MDLDLCSINVRDVSFNALFTAFFSLMRRLVCCLPDFYGYCSEVVRVYGPVILLFIGVIEA